MIFTLDPGSTNIGWALTDSKSTLTVGYGVFDYPVEKDWPFNQKINHRVKLFSEALKDLFEFSLNSPTHIVWEVVPGGGGAYGQKDAVVAMATTLKVITFQRNLPWSGYVPRSWHAKYLPGLKKVTKKDVKEKVLDVQNSLVKIPSNLPPDTYDAIAIGQVAVYDRDIVWQN